MNKPILGKDNKIFAIVTEYITEDDMWYLGYEPKRYYCNVNEVNSSNLLKEIEDTLVGWSEALRYDVSMYAVLFDYDEVIIPEKGLIRSFECGKAVDLTKLTIEPNQVLVLFGKQWENKLSLRYKDSNPHLN
jgi:hypothetical protein